MNIPSLEYILEAKNSRTQEKFIKKHFLEFYNYIINTYPVDLAWIEKLYWYYHNIKDYPKCYCGNRVKFKSFGEGYYSFCSLSCKSKGVLEKIKQTNLDKYGCEWNITSKESKNKQKLTCLERYGVDNYLKTDVIKKIKSSKEVRRKAQTTQIQTNLDKYGCEWNIASKESRYKQKQTKLRLYGDENYTNKEKAKQTNLKRYGVDNPMKNNTVSKKVSDKFKTKELQDQIYTSKKSHNTFNTSNIERELKNYLDEHNIMYKYQYKSDEYPFVCDFYFPDKDLYLEIQGSWTHGGHPFNPNNKNDLETLEDWKKKNTKFYNNAIETWTVRDVNKRQLAKKRNLNYIEVFSIKLNDIIQYIDIC